MEKVDYASCRDTRQFSFPLGGGIEIMGLYGHDTIYGWRMTDPGGRRQSSQVADYCLAGEVAQRIRSDEDQGYNVTHVLISNRLVVIMVLAGNIEPKVFEKAIEGKIDGVPYLILPEVELEGKKVTLTVLPEDKVGTDYFCTVNQYGFINEETDIPLRPAYLPPQPRKFPRR